MIGGGYNAPFGDFASTDWGDLDDIGGFAKPGYIVSLAYGYGINQNFGLWILGEHSSNGLDGKALVDAITNLSTEPTIENGGYQTTYILPGFYGGYSKNWLGLYLTANLGVAISNYTTTTFNGDDFEGFLERPTESNLGWNVGVLASVKIGDRFSAFLRPALQSSRLAQTVKTSLTVDNNGTSFELVNEFRQSMRLHRFTITAGLMYSLF